MKMSDILNESPMGRIPLEGDHFQIDGEYKDVIHCSLVFNDVYISISAHVEDNLIHSTEEIPYEVGSSSGIDVQDTMEGGLTVTHLTMDNDHDENMDVVKYFGLPIGRGSDASNVEELIVNSLGGTKALTEFVEEQINNRISHDRIEGNLSTLSA